MTGILVNQDIKGTEYQSSELTQKHYVPCDTWTKQI